MDDNLLLYVVPVNPSVGDSIKLNAPPTIFASCVSCSLFPCPPTMMALVEAVVTVLPLPPPMDDQ